MLRTRSVRFLPTLRAPRKTSNKKQQVTSLQSLLLLRDRREDAYVIIDSGDPEQAIAVALGHKPDAVMLDLMMPRFSGFEVCQTLTSPLSFTRRIPIFIVSEGSATQYKAFCQNLGVAAILKSPLTLPI
jgi:CheY-like chemotaxis protein